jgi:hypothetical protein
MAERFPIVDRLRLPILLESATIVRNRDHDDVKAANHVVDGLRRDF